LVGKRDSPLTYGARIDDVPAKVAGSTEPDTRRGPDHEVARDLAAHPLLELPTAHLVRAGPLPTLRLRLRRWHGRRVPIRAHPEVRFVRPSGRRVHRTPTAVPPGDRRGPSARSRSSRFPQGASPSRGGLPTPVSMSVLQSLRVAGVGGLRVRCPICPRLRGDVPMPRVRLQRAVRRGLVPRVPGRIPGRESAGSSRLFVPAVWDAGRLRRDSMLVRRLVRRV